MSIAKRQELAIQEANEAHIDKLVSLVRLLCKFLEKKPKPSNDEVRTKFIRLNDRWVEYCVSKRFHPSASLLFKREIAHLWKTRYASPNMTQKETQK